MIGAETRRYIAEGEAGASTCTGPSTTETLLVHSIGVIYTLLGCTNYMNVLCRQRRGILTSGIQRFYCMHTKIASKIKGCVCGVIAPQPQHTCAVKARAGNIRIKQQASFARDCDVP